MRKRWSAEEEEILRDARRENPEEGDTWMIQAMAGLEAIGVRRSISAISCHWARMQDAQGEPEIPDLGQDMLANKYQVEASRTAIYREGIAGWIQGVRDTHGDSAAWAEVTERLALCYAALALSAEAGEVAGVVSKLLRDNSTVDDSLARIGNETGDVLWHAAAVLTEAGWTMGTAMGWNLYKLQDRAARNVLGGSGDNR